MDPEKCEMRDFADLILVTMQSINPERRDEMVNAICQCLHPLAIELGALRERVNFLTQKLDEETLKNIL